ncbi:unnamed protein product [Phyllotreta striolata]|uniref:SUN domain-containing protein n=1 Tax=Phyllotreta striolata TaxID=444603 RepID=A0A9N9TXR3_PHYSR|nr:unnamed protein product [Phyllotreta striolata]
MNIDSSFRTVNIIFVAALILVVPCSDTSDERIEPNDSLNLDSSIHDLPNGANHPILEPSLEENLIVAIESDVTVKGPEASQTDKSEPPNSLVLNEASLSESSNQLADIPVIVSSQNEDALPQVESSRTVAEPERVPDIPVNLTAANETDSESDTPTKVDDAQKRDTENKTEDIPSFSEWAQKRLEEVEKSEQINSSAKGQIPNGKAQNAKLRWKNYASLDCGAKVVAANPEAVSPGAILSPSSDEYKLNPCTARIWFVVELCEAIQAKKIELANYELFSSSPKEFTVSVSERFPTRDWRQIGNFTADDERDVQSFDLNTQQFGKYIKIDVKSHYGSEHYCPISLFKAYGASVFEVLQKEEAANNNVNRPDDDDDDDDDDENITSDSDKKNIFSSATDAVISVVKRAAQILGTKSNDSVNSTKNSTASTLINTCTSPRHAIGCIECTETLFGQIYELLSCKSDEIERIASIPIVSKSLRSSTICESFGYRFGNVSSETCIISTIEWFLTPKYLGAVCHEIAILDAKIVVNVSQHFTNITEDLSSDKIVHLDVEDAIVTKVPAVLEGNVTFGEDSTEEPARIEPTKTLVLDENLTRTDVLVESSEGVVVPVETEYRDINTSTIETVTESSLLVDEVSDEQLNNIMVDLSAENSPKAAKESIFLRLFNRIKSLERNMSLSGQYLEELSKRYKRQVEEMREESQKRDESNQLLEERLDKLTRIIEDMSAERRTFLSVIYCLLCCGLCCLGVYFFCGSPSGAPIARSGLKDVVEVQPRKRRRKKGHGRSASLGSIRLGGDVKEPEGAVEEPEGAVEEPVVLEEGDRLMLEEEVELSSSQVDEVVELGGFPSIIGDKGGAKKDKKGFKRLLKKVF